MRRAFRHLMRQGHLPDWVELGGILACVRCTRGGRRVRALALPMPL